MWLNSSLVKKEVVEIEELRNQRENILEERPQGEKLSSGLG